jgi:hypothetical protein
MIRKWRLLGSSSVSEGDPGSADAAIEGIARSSSPTQMAPRRRLPLALLPLVTAASVWHWTAPWRTSWQRGMEEQQCRRHLNQFFEAFEAYRRDHGRYPVSPGSLYPRYLHSLSVFTCPAYHPSRFSVRLGQLVTFEGRRIFNTYYFPYVALLDPSMRLRPDRVPLMVCNIHAELKYEDNGRRPIRDRRQFVQRYGVPSLLVLSRDGRVRLFNDLNQPREGMRFLEFGLNTPSSRSRSDRPAADDLGLAHSTRPLFPLERAANTRHGSSDVQPGGKRN